MRGRLNDVLRRIQQLYFPDRAEIFAEPANYPPTLERDEIQARAMTAIARLFIADANNTPPPLSPLQAARIRVGRRWQRLAARLKAS